MLLSKRKRLKINKWGGANVSMDPLPFRVFEHSVSQSISLFCVSVHEWFIVSMAHPTNYRCLGICEQTRECRPFNF